MLLFHSMAVYVVEFQAMYTKLQADQLTLSQPGRADYTPYITTCPLKFSDLQTIFFVSTFFASNTYAFQDICKLLT